LRDIYNEGIKQLGRVYNNKDNELIKRLNPLYEKFKEIEMLTKYTSLSSFLDSLQNEDYSLDYNWQLIYNDHINFIVSSLKQEAPLLFYLILGKSINEISLPLVSNQPSSKFIPRESLAKIIKEHSVVKDMLNPWIEKIREYNTGCTDLIDNFLELESNQS